MHNLEFLTILFVYAVMGYAVTWLRGASFEGKEMRPDKRYIDVKLGPKTKAAMCLGFDGIRAKEGSLKYLQLVWTCLNLSWACYLC